MNQFQTILSKCDNYYAILEKNMDNETFHVYEPAYVDDVDWDMMSYSKDCYIEVACLKTTHACNSHPAKSNASVHEVVDDDFDKLRQNINKADKNEPKVDEDEKHISKNNRSDDKNDQDVENTNNKLDEQEMSNKTDSGSKNDKNSTKVDETEAKIANNTHNSNNDVHHDSENNKNRTVDNQEEHEWYQPKNDEVGPKADQNEDQDSKKADETDQKLTNNTQNSNNENKPNQESKNINETDQLIDSSTQNYNVRDENTDNMNEMMKSATEHDPLDKMLECCEFFKKLFGNKTTGTTNVIAEHITAGEYENESNIPVFAITLACLLAVGSMLFVFVACHKLSEMFQSGRYYLSS